MKAQIRPLYKISGHRNLAISKRPSLRSISIKSVLSFTCSFYFAFLFGLPCLAQDEIVFRTLLFRGYHENFEAGPRPATSSSDERTTLPLNFYADISDVNDINLIKEEISSVYRIPYVILLTSTSIVWDGKQENINQTAMYSLWAYPIQIFPKSVGHRDLKLKIEAFKFDYDSFSFLIEKARMLRAVSYGGEFELFADTQKIEDTVGGEQWLDTELTVAFNTPIVLVLPTEDRSLFLSVSVYRKKESRLDAGLVGNRLLSFGMGGIDPVCGKRIGKGDGYEKDKRPHASLNLEGETLFFCSEECLKRFKINPDKYLKHLKGQNKTGQTKPENQSMARPIRPIFLVIPMCAEAGGADRSGGRIKLEIAADQNGKAVNTRVIESDKPALEEAIQETLRQWVYEPRAQGGQPASSLYPVDVVIGPQRSDQSQGTEAPNRIALSQSGILTGVADYCAKLEKAALNFTCKENIAEKLDSGNQVLSIAVEVQGRREHGRPAGVIMVGQNELGTENSLTYDYQLIRKDGRIQEGRILIKENDQVAHDNNDYPRTKRFYINKSIFGPIGLLGREASPLFDYRMLKEDVIGGRPTFVLDVRPKSASSGKSIYGKVWVDQKDSSVLKMDIEAESLTGYERVAADYESRGVKPLISIEIVYGYEHNGLRYPSEITLKERYSDPKEGQINMSQLSVRYSQYKFFSVETDVKY